KAKGLEADVVFLADPCYAGRFPADLRVVREGVQATGWLRIARKSDERFGETLLAQPSDWQDHATIENRYLDAEQDRLLYVAATRARDLLVVGQHATAKENKAWAALSAFISERAADPPATERAAAQSALFDEPIEDQRQQAATERHARIHRAAQPSWSIASVSDEAHQSARAHRIRRSAGVGAEKGTETEEAEDPTRALLPDSASHRGDAGAAWGALVHGLLEYATQHPAATDDDLRRLARWLLVEAPDLRPFIDSAVACVGAIRHAPFWSSIQRSAKCFVEVPFIHRTGADRAATPSPSEAGPAVPLPMADGMPLQITMFDFFESQGQPASHARADAPMSLTRGVIDLVCHDETGWRIVDYKTDQILVDVGELAARYGEQVNRYALAWQDVVDEPVTRTELFHTRTLKLVSVQNAAPDQPQPGS
ncbi:MAG: 3'-5' exonuclease, partial [Vicinamibacterales bacterium]